MIGQNIRLEEQYMDATGKQDLIWTKFQVEQSLVESSIKHSQPKLISTERYNLLSQPDLEK